MPPLLTPVPFQVMNLLQQYVEPLTNAAQVTLMLYGASKGGSVP